MTRMTGPDCVVMCNLINTYIHRYIYTYIHTYIHTYVHTYIHTYVYIFIHKYIHIIMSTEPIVGVGKLGRTKPGSSGFLNRQRPLLKVP